VLIASADVKNGKINGAHHYWLTVVRSTWQMSPWNMLQGKLCGLCGNNNYDTSDDMMTLDSQQMMTSSRLFVLDNLLPSSHCDASHYQTQLALRHQGTQTVREGILG